MEEFDPFLMTAAAVSMVIVWFKVFVPMLWRHQDKITPKHEPKPEPGPGKIEVPRPPVICSIELSSDELFEVIADGAMRKAGREDLREYDWTVTMSLTDNRRGVKKVTVEIMGRAAKQRGHLWLVKE